MIYCYEQKIKFNFNCVDLNHTKKSEQILIKFIFCQLGRVLLIQ